MGSNEIKNSIEACAWIVAGRGASPGESPLALVAPENFFFRSISGFQDRIDVISPVFGSDWAVAQEIIIGLYLDRNYSRAATTLLLKNINSIGLGTNTPPNPALVQMMFSPNVQPLTAAAYEALYVTGTADPLPDDQDPFDRLVITMPDLQEDQIEGHGTEFGIVLLSMPQNDDGDTDVQQIITP